MKKNYLKLGMMVVFMLSVSILSAQTDPTTTTTAGDKQAAVVPGTASITGSVRVIDNKGTIKYLQSNNGITTINNSTANGDVTTTTFQLGGTLTDDTYIDVDGNVFVLNGLVAPTLAPIGAVVDGSDGSGTTETGWAFLVRDEGTGETQKLALSSLIESAYDLTTISGTLVADRTIDLTITLPTTAGKIWVYRNGAKLNKANADYTVSGTTVIIAASAGSDPNDWTLYVGDVIEIQVISF